MNRRKFLSCAVLAATAGATGGAMAMGTASGYNVVGFAALTVRWARCSSIRTALRRSLPSSRTAAMNFSMPTCASCRRRAVRKSLQGLPLPAPHARRRAGLGLYADYQNQVEVTARSASGPGRNRQVHLRSTPARSPAFRPAPRTKKSLMFKANVKKVSKKFADRLYFVNNLGTPNAQTMRTIWNNPMGGAIDLAVPAQDGHHRHEGRNPLVPRLPRPLEARGSVFQRRDDGLPPESGRLPHFRLRPALRQVRPHGPQDLEPPSPNAYADFSHALDPAQNGHYFLRAPPPTCVAPMKSACTRCAT